MLYIFYRINEKVGSELILSSCTVLVQPQGILSLSCFRLSELPLQMPPLSLPASSLAGPAGAPLPQSKGDLRTRCLSSGNSGLAESSLDSEPFPLPRPLWALHKVGVYDQSK